MSSELDCSKSNTLRKEGYILIFLIGIKSMILEAKSDPVMIAWMSSGINAFINSNKKKIWIDIFILDYSWFYFINKIL